MTLGAAVEHRGIQCDAFQQGSRSTSFQRWWCCAHRIPANNGSRRAARRAEVTGGGSTTSGQRQRDNRAALRWTSHWRQRVHCSQECGHHRKFGSGVGCPGQGHSPSSAAVQRAADAQVPTSDVECERALRRGDGSPRGPRLGGAKSLPDEPHTWRLDDRWCAPADGQCARRRREGAASVRCGRAQGQSSIKLQPKARIIYYISEKYIRT